MASVTFVSK